MNLAFRPCLSCSYGHRAPRARSVGPVNTETISAPDGDLSRQVVYRKDSWQLANRIPCRCPTCSGRVFEAEKILSRRAWYHKQCFKCR